MTCIPLALHEAKPANAALVLQGKPLAGGGSLCPVPKPWFFTLIFLLGLNTATGNQLTARGPSAKVLPPPFGFHPFPFVILPLATCCCQ